MGTLTITPTWDTSVTALNTVGNANYNPTLYSEFVGAVNLAISYFDNNYTTIGTTNVNINIAFGYGSVSVPGVGVTTASGDTLGTSPVSAYVYNWADFSKLVATAAAAPDATAAEKTAWMLVTSNTTLASDTGATFTVNPAELKLLNPAYASAQGYDPSALDGGSVIQVSSDWNWTQTNFTPNQYDAVATEEHEISEVLGRSMNGGVGDQYTLEDFFDYTAQGNPAVGSTAAANVAVGSAAGSLQLNVTAANTPQTYFSSDGKTVGLAFTVPASANDIADWSSSGNDAFGSGANGVASPISSTDVAVMQALGLVPKAAAASGPNVVTVRGASGAILSFQFADSVSAAVAAAAVAPINAAVLAGTTVPSNNTSAPPAPGAGLLGLLQVDAGGSVALPSGYAAAALDATAPVTVSGGASNGQVVIAGSAGLAFNAGAGAGSVFATGGNDLVSAYPGSGNQYVQVGNGNDTIVALAGNDTIMGGTGNNQILTGAGNDIIATNGTDLIAAGAIGAATITAGANNPTAFFGPGSTVFNAGSGKATVVGTTGANTVNAQGGTQIWLGSKTDVVNTTGADTIIGSSGAATVNASGNSFLFAGSGKMNFLETAGVQTILGAASGAMSISGGAGSVVALSYGNTQFTGGSGAATIAGFGGSMTVTGGSGAGLFLGGTAGGNSITGGSGQSIILGNGNGDVLTAGTGLGDVIKAGAGAETVSAAGRSGTEKLYGGSGADVIMTGRGNANVLVGTGATTLVAGGGTDLYALTNGDANNVLIQNFSASVDYISLVGFGAGAVNAALAGAVTSGGSEMLTLSDGTHVTLQGFTGLSSASFL